MAALGAPRWWTVVAIVADLALLCWPSSCRFVWRQGLRRGGHAPAGTGTSPWDPAIAPDGERPDGWYVDPEHPWRMRFWNGERREWQGRVRTPRQISAEVDAGEMATAPAQTAWDPRAQPDADRPRGWYVDPAEPTHMRFWAGEASGWQGRAKTPGNIRDSWQSP